MLLLLLLIILVGIITLYYSFKISGDNIEEIKKISIDNQNEIDIELFKMGLNNLDIKNEKIIQIKNEIKKRIVGMDDFINSLLVALLAQGNILVEGVPGLAKTKTIQTLSDILDLEFSRIQFTTDMLPSDIIGTEILNMKSHTFETRLGPVFANLVLTDEINRTTPKVQSALLEAMEEKKITIGKNTYDLPTPFFVMATQNPIEQEGTYLLPEAQVDRFMFKILVNYPTSSEETQILNWKENEQNVTLSKVVSKEELIQMQNEVNKITVSDELKEYISRLVSATRDNKSGEILYGSSPRGTLNILVASKAVAYIKGRNYVKFEDIQSITLNTLRHRIILTYDAISNGIITDELLLNLLKKVHLFD